MKLLLRFKILLTSLVIVILYLIIRISIHNNLKVSKDFISNKNKSNDKQINSFYTSDVIHIAVVSCGDRVQETLMVLKSALLLTQSSLHFIILADDKSILNFKEKLSEWQTISKTAFQYDVMKLRFPKNNEVEWRRLFKPCASQRLFLPSVLPNVDSVLYVDTDTLFLTPVEEVWEHFKKMNSSQLAALAPEHEDANVGWYNRFARHPYYGPFGVNSGVMLMNLTRMREFKWTEYVIPVYKKYKLNITWGDQDIINIIFHYHPDKLYIYPCRYNYRPDHCMYMSVCKSAEQNGVAVIHGSRGFFHSQKQAAFHAIFRAFEEYQIGTDAYINFLLPLENYLDFTTETKCGQVKSIFLKNLRKYLVPPIDEKR